MLQRYLEALKAGTLLWTVLLNSLSQPYVFVPFHERPLLVTPSSMGTKLLAGVPLAVSDSALLAKRPCGRCGQATLDLITPIGARRKITLDVSKWMFSSVHALTIALAMSCSSPHRQRISRCCHSSSYSLGVMYCCTVGIGGNLVSALFVDAHAIRRAA